MEEMTKAVGGREGEGQGGSREEEGGGESEHVECDT